MPLLQLQTSVELTDDQRRELLPALAKIVAESIGKPEQYVMVTVSAAAVLMAGGGGPAAFADVRSIGGLNGRVNKQIAQKVCALLEQRLGIAPGRVYLNFTDVAAAHWGWQSGTFG
jgi:phenylpyruvate tautomerase PptA (4-oxalocrotonate tautomerase family)